MWNSFIKCAIVDGLHNSVTSELSVFTLCKFSTDSIKLRLTERLYACEDGPSKALCARRCSQRTLVCPIRAKFEVSNEIKVGLIIQNGLDESIFFSEVEENSKHGQFAIGILMNNVHLSILELTVNRMF